MVIPQPHGLPHPSNLSPLPSSRQAFDVALIADVAVPLLDFSERTLEFHHAYEKGAAIDVIKRPITLR